jgi:hypothetical protein
MKNTTPHFLARLIASLPVDLIRKSNQRAAKPNNIRRREPSPAREETLNRIFMVRYRIQHL